MLEGFATKSATEHYFEHHVLPFSRRRVFQEKVLSSLGLGSSLGEIEETTSKSYEARFFEAALAGINCFDTAAHYRRGRSEQDLGKALIRLKERGISREALFITSKGGKVCFREETHDFEGYLREHFLRKGLCSVDEIFANDHCMSVPFLAHSLNTSLERIKLSSLDLYFLYNPEVFLLGMGEAHFYEKLKEVFAFFEGCVREKKIQSYGISTWNGFRQKMKALQLDKILECAESVGGTGHHFSAIQLPLNLVMTEALSVPNQEETRTVLSVAEERGVAVFTSAPLMQGQVLALPKRTFEKSPKGETPFETALEFVLSAPHITSSFLGVQQKEHLEEALESLSKDAWTLETWRQR